MPITPARLRVLAALIGASVAGAFAPCVAAADDDFLLIDRTLVIRSIRVDEIGEQRMAFRDETGSPRAVSLDQCVALIRPSASSPRPPDGSGRLMLSDGQSLPGHVAGGAPADDAALAWVHPWLGRITVPLDHVAAVSLVPGAVLPEPGGTDVVVMRIGDRLEGFITRIGDPVVIEVGLEGQSRPVRIPLERLASLALVTPRKPPLRRRVWFADGTAISADHLTVGDDGYVRLGTEWSDGLSESPRARLSDVVAILFDPSSMVALGSLRPSRVERTVPRYVVPGPRSLNDGAPLDLGPIEYRGPMLVRYALPKGARRFAAEARLPEAARTWGDYEVIIRDDDREVYRCRLNADHPVEQVNVDLAGSEMVIELTQGANGPIQDHLRLARAILLVE